MISFTAILLKRYSKNDYCFNMKRGEKKKKCKNCLWEMFEVSKRDALERLLHIDSFGDFFSNKDVLECLLIECGI